MADHPSAIDGSESLLDYPPLPPLQENIARTALIDFLGGSYAPVRGAEQAHTFITPEGSPLKRLPTCAYAEDGFITTFEAMQNGTAPKELGFSGYIGWTTVVDSDSQPIAIENNHGIRSALSFRPLTIDGYIHPAGSLLRLSLHQKPEHSRTWTVASRHVTPVTNIEAVKFLRLSAFAHSPEERRRIFSDLDYGKVAAGTSISALKTLVRSSLEASGPIGF